MRQYLRKLADNQHPDSLANRFRRRRGELFSKLFLGNAPLSILDLGGTLDFWNHAGIHLPTGTEVTIVNLTGAESRIPGFTFQQGDARSLPQFSDQSFDIVFSNSVIEHVGTFEDQRSMAREVMRIGRSWLVQTPNYYFPLEPHFLFPGFQFLPESVQIWLVEHYQLGWFPKATSRAEAAAIVSGTRLLTKRELRTLFPSSELVPENVGPFVKSWMVIGRR